MSIVGWTDEMEMDGVTCIGGANLLDDLTPQQLAVPFEEDFQLLSSSDGLSSHAPFLEPYSNTNMGGTGSSSFRPQVPDFLSLHNSDSNQWDGCSVDSFWPKTGGTDPANTANYKNTASTDGHVLAERKRRAKLSRQIMALIAIVPGIRKMDKVTILEDTIKYLKQLQEREKKLEKQISKKKMESVVSMKKLIIQSDSGENFSTEKPLQPLPQIEVKISDRNVLIRIHCETRKGVLVKVVEETEKLNLTVVNSSVIQFETSTLDITLLVQMDGESMMTMEDIVNSLHSSLTHFMESNLGREHEHNNLFTH